MGTYIWTQLRFGGRLRKSDYDDLPEHLQEAVDEAIEDGTFATWEGETNYGNADDETSALADAGLTYRRYCDGVGGEFSAVLEWYEPGLGKPNHECACDEEKGEPIITLADAEKALAAGKTLADLVAGLAWTRVDPPPVTMIDDEAADAEPDPFTVGADA